MTSDNVRIIEATEEDLPELSLMYIAYLNEYDMGQDPKVLSELLNTLVTKKRVVILVAKEGKLLLGFASCIFTYSAGSACEAMEVMDLYVELSKRRRGIGRMLLSVVEELAIKNNIKKIYACIDTKQRRITEFYGCQKWDNLGLTLHRKNLVI